MPVPLPPDVVLLVLLAALLHAGWNAMVKGGGDPVSDLALVWGGAALAAVPLLALVPPPAPAAWPWLAGSVAVHAVYFGLLARSYVVGDLGHVYTVMRGTPPLMVAVAATLWLDEPLSPVGWAGILLISTGILALGFSPGAPLRATGYALATAAATACYTLLDGQGSRASGAPAGYVTWFFLLNAVPPCLMALALSRGRILDHARRHWRRALGGGGASLGAYGIVLWAMAQAPIAPVAALREVSVVFAALIGTVLLKEPFGRPRIVAALLVAGGGAALRFA